MSKYGRIANRVIANPPEGRSLEGAIYTALVTAGAPPCVAREWANEPRRRASNERKRRKRAARKQASNFGQRYETMRRIIFTEERDGVLREFHATKGWRAYKVPS